MADVNAPSDQAPAMAPPVRTDDQILPRIRWVPIGKSNCYLDLEKSQSNPIYKIAVDLLKHTNFFKAFTASSTIPSIYIQQFWDTIQYDKKVGCYRCQLDEQWFVLTKDTLREALQITLVNNNQAFVAPPSSDALVNFVNEMGYPKLVRNLSNTKGSCATDSMGVVTRAHIDYAERIWEEFTQSIHTFIEDKRNLSRHTTGKKKATLIVIPSIRFTKLIIHHLQRRHMFHPRPDSPLHLPNEEPILGYLKFSAKGTKREIFRMPIPGNLIATDIQEASYYREYLAKVAQFNGKKRTLKYVAESVAEDAPAKEPQVVAEDADLEKALEESMKRMYAAPRGPLPPVVIREPESGKYQPLPEVPGKGKAKETEEQVAHDLLSLQKPKKKIHSDSEEESEKVVLGADEGGQDEGHAGPDHGQAGPYPGNAGADELSMPSPVVHAGSDHEHMDLDVADVSPQPSTEQLDEGFTATAYPKVQENLKLTVEEQVLLEEPASSSGTLYSLQHLSEDISFGDMFFSDKPSEADNDKANAETEVESMVTVTMQQDMSSLSLMTSPIIDLTSIPESPKAMMMKRIGELEHIMTNLIQENKGLEERLDSHGARLYTLEQLDIPHWVSKAVTDMKEILHQRMWETESYKSHEDHMQLYEALEKSMNRDHSQELAQDLAEARKKKKKSRESPKTPPGSTSSATSTSSTSRIIQSFRSSWSFWILLSAATTTFTFIHQSRKPSISLTPADLEMDEDMGPDEQAQSSDDEDIGSTHIPKVNLRQEWWKPLEEERPATSEPAWSIPSSDAPVPTNNWASALASNYSPLAEDSLLAQTGDIATFIDWFYKRRGITELKPQDLEGPAFEIVKVFHPDVIHLQYQMEECHKLLTDSVDDPILRHNVSKPLPLGGPPQVTIQSDFFFNKDLEYLRYSSKGSRPALSISKMKAAYYPDAGLEQMVLYQFWIEEE
nr:monodehydroascorbate reductase [Tanacetum cinerariifolium]